MKKKTFISASLVMAIFISLLGGFSTSASAVNVRDLSEFILASADPQDIDPWKHNTFTLDGTVNGANNSRIISYSGSSTTNHISISLPSEYAVNNNANAKPYILHFSYRILNDRTNPAYITHRMQYYNNSPKELFNVDTTTFTLYDDQSKNITSSNASSYNYLDFYDYKVDLYENLKTGAYKLYLNGVQWLNSYDYANVNAFGSNSSTLLEYRIRVMGGPNSTWAFSLVNPCYEIYSQDVLMEEIIAATLSGMSNYSNSTGPTEVANRKIDSTENGTITLSPPQNTDSASYSATGVSDGVRLIWWTGDESGGTGHKPKFSNAGTVSGREWFHMGFNITGTNVKIQLGANLYRSDNGNIAKYWDILDAYQDSNYRVDYIFDLEHDLCYIYYNNVYHSLKNDDFVKQIRQIKLSIRSTANFTISNISFKYYPKGMTPGDVLIGYDSRSKENPDYIYQINGIQSGTNVIGRMAGICTVTGDNSGGYTLSPNSIDETNGGYARYTLNYTESDQGAGIYQSTNDKVLWYHVKYKPSVVSGKHQIGIRGNNGYRWFLTAQNNRFTTDTGDYIKSYNTSTFYDIDFIVNNKDYKYYWLIDGVCFESGTIEVGRQPIWQIAFTMRNSSDRIVLKNMQTTLYKNNYTLLNIVKPLLTRIYANLEGCTVSNNTASVTTSYIANTTNAANANTKVIYAVYNAAGKLLKYKTAGSSSNVNGANLTTSVDVTGGTTLKVFMWNLNPGSRILTPIANSITTSLQ